MEDKTITIEQGTFDANIARSLVKEKRSEAVEPILNKIKESASKGEELVWLDGHLDKFTAGLIREKGFDVSIEEEGTRVSWNL